MNAKVPIINKSDEFGREYENHIFNDEVITKGVVQSSTESGIKTAYM